MMLIFVLIPVIMIFSFMISFNMSNTITKEYDHSMKINITLSELSIELSKSANSFDMYIRNRNDEYLAQFHESQKKILKIFTLIEPDIKRDKDSGIYFRNLSNMFEYQQNLTNEILLQDRLSIETYQKLNELKTLSHYMNSHSQMLTTTYLDYSSTQYSSLLGDYKIIEQNIYILTIFFSILSIIFAVALSNDLLIVIEGLSKSAHKLSKGYWEVPDIKENQYSELNVMAQAFNNMKNNIKFYIEELSQKAEMEINLNKEKLVHIEKDKLLKEAQLKVLQMQMDPHFLFNTLNTIARIAMFENADNTVKLIESTAKILRYSLNAMSKLVSLEEELSTLKAYIFIQETRFQEQISFNLDIDTELDDIMIPPMTLQPLVENAIIHGLKDKEEGGQIEVIISRREDHIHIQVNDNGQGIGPETIKHIFEEKIQKKKGHTTGLGLSNVSKRLQLHFNNNNPVKVFSTIGIGTQVVICIPLKGGQKIAEAYDC